jgi:hypothetical protein
MKIRIRLPIRRPLHWFEIIAITFVLLLTGAAHRLRADCNPNPTPFIDLGTVTLCQAIFEAYFTGLANGTSANTYSPSANVTREQMAAFTTRTLDQGIRRGSRRAALNQRWLANPNLAALNLVTTQVGDYPTGVASDGADVWVANGVAATNGGSVSRVRASDGKLLGTWGGADCPTAVIVALGRVFTVGTCGSGNLYMIDPKQTSGSVSTAASGIGACAHAIAFDGTRFWIPSCGSNIKIVTPTDTMPWSVTTVSGFNNIFGIVYDGSHMWVTSWGDKTIKKLDSAGNVLQSVPVGNQPGHPAFDGVNIWVPNYSSNDVTVVRATDSQGNPITPFVVQTVSAFLMAGPQTAAFDGERVLIACEGNSVFVFRATDLSFLGAAGTGARSTPFGACSDGLNFWVTLRGTDKLLRF